MLVRPAAPARLSPAPGSALAFKYAGGPQAAADIAAALRRANEAKASLKADPMVATFSGSTNSPVSPEQEEVGGMGQFAKDSKLYEKEIYANAEKAFTFEHDYLNPPEPGALA